MRFSFIFQRRIILINLNFSLPIFAHPIYHLQNLQQNYLCPLYYFIVNLSIPIIIHIYKMLVTEPTLQKRNNTMVQRQLTDFQGIKTTKRSENIRTTKLPQNLRNTKLSQSISNQAKQAPQNQRPPIQKIYSELHDYINTVDSKIQYLLEKQSNEYKVVYQHYYNKFKDQLYELKQKTYQQQKTFLQNDHVHYIENQLKISRQQACTYQNLYQKTKLQNDSLKLALDLRKRDITMLQVNAKLYIKQIKNLKKSLDNSNINQKPQSLLNNSSYDFHKKHQTNDEFPQNNNQSPLKQYKIYNSSKRSNSLTLQIPLKPQIKISLDQFSPKFNCLKSDSKFSPQTNILSAVANQIKSQSIRSVQNSQAKEGKLKQEERLGFFIKPPRKQKQHLETEINEKAENSMKVFNICEWFLQCVESVKKQILQRKSKYFNQPLRISNWFRNFNSLEDFLNIDKLQVLKIFFSKKECIQMIYNFLKNQRNTQQSEDLYKISQYQNSSEVSQFNHKNVKNHNFQSHESLNHTIFNLPDKLKFNKTSLQMNYLENKKMLHRSLNEKQMVECMTNGTNGNQKTSNSLTKEGLNCIQEAGEHSSLNKNMQRPLTIADLVEKRNSKRLTHIIKEKKNIRLSTHLIVRKKRMILE